MWIYTTDCVRFFRDWIFFSRSIVEIALLYKWVKVAQCLEYIKHQVPVIKIDFKVVKFITSSGAKRFRSFQKNKGTIGEIRMDLEARALEGNLLLKDLDKGIKAGHKPAKDFAYSVANFTQSGGSFVNYYMYHWRTTGGPFISTSYDYDAPVNEYVGRVSNSSQLLYKTIDFEVCEEVVNMVNIKDATFWQMLKRSNLW
ncbi:hypothetical protein M8C21_033616, partial [Ambrosia artemisiifolia]